MEDGPNFRIVGKVDDNIKEHVKSDVRNSFGKDHMEGFSNGVKELIESNEIPKTLSQESAIEWANQESSRIMEVMGIRPYTIPTSNIHIIPRDIYVKITDTKDEYESAVSDIGNQVILVDASKITSEDPLELWSTIFHEVLHLKAHASVHAVVREEDDESVRVRKTEYRSGVSVLPPQSKDQNLEEEYEYFRGLHEAIVADLQKEYDSKIINLPEFRKQHDWMNSEEAKKIKYEFAKQEHISIDEIKWVSKEGRVDRVCYPHFRKAFYYVIEEIKDQFKDQFPDKESIKKEFIKAHFTGRLLPIARLMKETFGELSFRILGGMKDEESAVHTMKLLQKARIQIKNNS